MPHAFSAAERTRPPTLLFVEDNPDHALLLHIAAVRACNDADVRVVTTGEEARRYLDAAPWTQDPAEVRPSLVVLDLLLPGMGGLEVLEWLHRRPGLADIPAVVLTSSLDPRDRARAATAGASACYVKPTDAAELERTVRTILERWLV